MTAGLGLSVGGFGAAGFLGGRGVGKGERMDSRIRGNDGGGWVPALAGTSLRSQEQGGRLTLCWRRGYTLFVSFPRRIGPEWGRRMGGSAEDSTPRSPPVLPLYMKVLRCPTTVAGLAVRLLLSDVLREGMDSRLRGNDEEGRGRGHPHSRGNGACCEH